MTGIEFVLVVLGGLVLMSLAVVVTAVLVVRAVFRRFRRSRAVGPLRMRTNLSHGPKRSVLRLRTRLADSLRSGQAAIELGAGGAPDTVGTGGGRSSGSGRSGSGRPGAGHAGRPAGPRRELARLFARIQDEARVLDLQLQLLESEFDSGVLQSELGSARRRVEQVEHLVRQVRSAVASGLSGTTDDTLADLDAEVEREVQSLHAGIQQLQDLNRRDHAGRPQPAAAAAPAAAATPAAARPAARDALREPVREAIRDAVRDTAHRSARGADWGAHWGANWAANWGPGQRQPSTARDKGNRS
ncbi:hypothetical protein ACDF64_08735 [Agromyces sp. MMS24-JH15]|uniref:hypothetical protein n=1 Tax=Agromyces sp. MMS24-JH15 TaxID=3243765 RepID=UPI00374A8A23